LFEGEQSVFAPHDSGGVLESGGFPESKSGLAESGIVEPASGIVDGLISRPPHAKPRPMLAAMRVAAKRAG